MRLSLTDPFTAGPPDSDGGLRGLDGFASIDASTIAAARRGMPPHRALEPQTSRPHTGLEPQTSRPQTVSSRPQTSRPQTGLLLTHLSLALDSRALRANPNPYPYPNPNPNPNPNQPSSSGGMPTSPSISSILMTLCRTRRRRCL